LKNPLEFFDEGGNTTSFIGLKKFLFYDSLRAKLLLYLNAESIALVGDLLP
jgi:hypothetical protein